MTAKSEPKGKQATTGKPTMTVNPRIKLPDTMTVGETIEVKALVRHPMERGNRNDAQGQPIARDIIHTFTADLDGTRIFDAAFGTGVAANPFMSFYLRAARPGLLKLTWIGDNDFKIEAERQLNVVG